MGREEDDAEKLDPDYMYEEDTQQIQSVDDFITRNSAQPAFFRPQLAEEDASDSDFELPMIKKAAPTPKLPPIGVYEQTFDRSRQQVFSEDHSSKNTLTGGGGEVESIIDVDGEE